MSLNCSVKGCTSNNSTNEQSTLHSFPFKNPEIVQKWLDKIDLVEELSSFSRVCSRHFDSNCLDPRNQDQLLPDAIPNDSKVCL